MNDSANTGTDDFDEFDDFETDSQATSKKSDRSDSFDASSKLDFYSSIPVIISLEVGSTTVPLNKLMNADSSTIIELDKLADEPLDIKVNGQLFGQGEVVVKDNRYSLKVLRVFPTDGNNG